MTEMEDLVPPDEDLADEEFLVPQVPRDLVKNPPDLDDDGQPLAGRVYPVRCFDEGGCGWFGDIEIAQGSFDPSGFCPDCKKDLVVDFSRMSWGIGSRGAGYHDTAWGRRVKQDRTKRNERLAKRQWSDVAPASVVNPERVVNPTEGGVFDPNSKFNKHKNRSKKIIYKK